MTNIAEEKKAQLIDRIASALEERLPDKQTALLAQRFARQYYAWVAPEDLLDDDPEDLYGEVLAHWNFTRQRQPGTALVRVYNPDFEVHGWQSTHTVIEIVTDDLPFLVDSITMALNRHGLTVHRIIHPVLHISRDHDGHLQDVLPSDRGRGNGIAEATMHFEVDRQSDPAVLKTLTEALKRVLNDVRIAVEDWRAMRAHLVKIIDGLDAAKLPLPAEEIQESKAFLNWVADNHFTFLGYRNYDLVEENGEMLLRSVAGSGLGVLRDDGAPRVSVSFMELPPALRQLAYAPNLLLISKANTRSTVHRPAHLDYIGIKRFDATGKVSGEWRFLGLYTSQAYSMSPRNIPLLRNKIQRVMTRAKLSPTGHTGKTLQNILETFPRDDLFQATEDELFDIAMGILHLQERQRLRLFVRQDIFARFISCMVYVPRDRYNTELRLRMQDILMPAFNGLACEFITQFSESVLARVLFHIRTTPGQIPDYSLAELEARLREAMLSWEDELHRALLEHCGEAQGNAFFQRYSAAFPAGYREDFTTRTAVYDILRLEQISATHSLEMHLYRTLEDPDGLLRFKLFGPQHIPLSDVLPMLEKLGLRVLKARPYEIGINHESRLWILDFDMQEDQDIQQVDAAQCKDIFQEAFAQLWRGAMENDGFNRLVLGAGLPWRDVVMLRAYCKYLLQTRMPFSQAYMEQTLCRHTHIAKYLAQLFHARFDPHCFGDHERQTTALAVAIEEALEQVSNLDEDRIVRRFLNIIQATLRTNFFQVDHEGQNKEYLSFKLNPAMIDDLPLPRPMFEIFVYSPRTEAVHLRGGPVARGGLRWSDRREDFRTEVLGLMKAQMVKNAVIVPVGSKGGFVVKRPPSEREALQQEVVHCYQTFIRGMLDLTDNRRGDAIATPPQVVRYDQDDPYLVVAADKGTATFSDLANSIAKSYGFWLGDAFASGGSAGYDHKKMGITARGAWESVKRHFRELGMDIQHQDDFTVVGIGDMSGDVFGNGMLLSRHIKLLAAFNHLHIFLDPNPDPETSFRERERLFQLPRSTWDDYDKSLLSTGGGIYPRTAKAIHVSPEARVALGLKSEHYTPNELVHNLLKAPVDLLWNGGIGTYVKATSETHAEVGDKTSDSVRVNGRDLRCRVVGEGGNLGFTQRGRIEYTLQGGKILTDAIDNSGGVNCSDHEVNIKILLNQVVENGDMTEKQRNQLLSEMTAEVAELVLRQNYLQPEAISITASRAAEALGDHVRVIRSLEKAGKLDRALEFLPNDEELAEREAEQRGLVPPEMAILLAYSKISLFEELIDSNVPEDPYLQRELLAYFPQPLGKSFAKEMQVHPLRREIIATYITNSMLNRMGSVFAIRLGEDTGERASHIARAYSAARELWDARRLWNTIDLLDNQVSADVQIRMHIKTRHLLERASRWLLRNRRPPLDVETLVKQFATGIAALRTALPNLLPATENEKFQQASQELSEAGVPQELAQWIASLEMMYSALDLVEVATQIALPVESVAAVHFALVDRLELNWLQENIIALPVTTHWQQRAQAALVDGFYTQARALTADVLRLTAREDPPEARLAAWLEQNRRGVGRCLGLFADLRSSAGQPDLAMLSVALRETANLLQSSGS